MAGHTNVCKYMDKLSEGVQDRSIRLVLLAICARIRVLLSVWKAQEVLAATGVLAGTSEDSL